MISPVFCFFLKIESWLFVLQVEGKHILYNLLTEEICSCSMISQNISMDVLHVNSLFIQMKLTSTIIYGLLTFHVFNQYFYTNFYVCFVNIIVMQYIGRSVIDSKYIYCLYFSGTQCLFYLMYSRNYIFELIKMDIYVGVWNI